MRNGMISHEDRLIAAKTVLGLAINSKTQGRGRIAHPPTKKPVGRETPLETILRYLEHAIQEARTKGVKYADCEAAAAIQRIADEFVKTDGTELLQRMGIKVSI